MIAQVQGRIRFLDLTIGLYIENSMPSYLHFYTWPDLFYTEVSLAGDHVTNPSAIAALETAALNAFNLHTDGNKALGAVLMGAPVHIYTIRDFLAATTWRVLGELPAEPAPITPSQPEPAVIAPSQMQETDASREAGGLRE